MIKFFVIKVNLTNRGSDDELLSLFLAIIFIFLSQNDLEKVLKHVNKFFIFVQKTLKRIFKCES